MGHLHVSCVHVLDSVAEADFTGADLTTLGSFFRNSSLLSPFLLNVDGLFFFRTSPLAEVVFGLAGGVFSQVSREKQKSEPMVREMLKAFPRQTSAWQKARH